MRWGAVLLAVTLGASACSDDDTAPEAAPADDLATHAATPDTRDVEVFGATLSYSADPDNGVATAIRPIDFETYEATYTDPERRDVPLAFALRACTLHSATRQSFDVQWLPPADIELPVTVQLYVGIGGTAATYLGFGGIGTYEVELARPGTFRIVQDLDPELFGSDADDARTAGVGGDDFGRECRLQVVSEFYVDDQTDPDVAFRDAEDLVAVDAAPGSFQALAGSAHGVAGKIERLLLDAPADFDAWPDHVWLDPDGALTSLRISDRFGCWEVTSTWVADRSSEDPGVRMVQSRGCDPPHRYGSLDRVVVVDDAAWYVEVQGAPDDVEALVAGLRAVPVEGVDPLPAGLVGHDAQRAFEEQLSEAGGTIWARLDWNGALVLVHTWRDDGLDDRLREVEAAAFRDREEVTSASSGTPIQQGICIATFTGGDAEGGFAFVYYDDPAITRVEVETSDGAWDEVPIEDAGPFRVGLLAGDLTADQFDNFEPPAIRGFDADGEQIDCVRNGR